MFCAYTDGRTRSGRGDTDLRARLARHAGRYVRRIFDATFGGQELFNDQRLIMTFNDQGLGVSTLRINHYATQPP